MFDISGNVLSRLTKSILFSQCRVRKSVALDRFCMVERTIGSLSSFRVVKMQYWHLHEVLQAPLGAHIFKPPVLPEAFD